MIDGLYKSKLDTIWNVLARPVARVLTANQVTYSGLGLVVASCAAFLWHGSTPLFGLCLLVSFAADSLDGAVARLRGEASHYGGYLDAMIDRYQEVILFVVLGFVSGAYLPAFLACTGALITSYAKARTAIEMSISNEDWPDFFERQERLIFVIVMLLVLPWLAFAFGKTEGQMMSLCLWILAGLCHATALQRFSRARNMLSTFDVATKAKAAPMQAPEQPQKHHLS
ncbi:CDP-alcohol phosphatidyltransferase family protein [Aestuariivirga litoralis]|uniref:CDP-alcohol phosphatidyltransferase family protein n=1 Tax=Aestuariivirga litoralis TaxID=2650924 RepID=UPI0018C63E78|nr:CDP-alcohol phosphatidyltransferase family protein [Aestuariivirga litoralis]MBG1230787.1 CDP-alcohol phosphatidyltransferase family protein [Aestuariivirga litoralis]